MPGPASHTTCPLDVGHPVKFCNDCFVRLPQINTAVPVVYYDKWRHPPPRWLPGVAASCSVHTLSFRARGSHHNFATTVMVVVRRWEDERGPSRCRLNAQLHFGPLGITFGVSNVVVEQSSELCPKDGRQGTCSGIMNSNDCGLTEKLMVLISASWLVYYQELTFVCTFSKYETLSVGLLRMIKAPEGW